MTVYEHGDEIVVVDAGLAFPRDEHLGVDLVLPDIGYLRDRRVNAVVLTHGHEDHVGGLPYLLREVDCDQVIATKLTLGLIKSKLDEHGLTASTQLEEARDRQADPGRLVHARLRPRRALDPGLRRDRARDGGRPGRPHRRLEARPHARRRPEDRRRPARRARQPGRRPAARRLDERRAARDDRLGAARRRGVPDADPAAQGPDPRRLLRVERAPDAAGDRRRDPGRAQGGDRRPLDAQEPQHRPAARLPRRAGAHPDQAAGGDGAAARPGDDPLHGQPGRADVRADADRLQRPPVRSRSSAATP